MKGKEFLTITYDDNNDTFSKTENIYNVTKNVNSYFIVNLGSTSTYTHDGFSDPRVTNVSYQYDNYSNVKTKISLGDVNIDGDEKYENYNFIP